MLVSFQQHKTNSAAASRCHNGKQSARWTTNRMSSICMSCQKQACIIIWTVNYQCLFCYNWGKKVMASNLVWAYINLDPGLSWSRFHLASRDTSGPSIRPGRKSRWFTVGKWAEDEAQMCEENLRVGWRTPSSFRSSKKKMWKGH